MQLRELIQNIDVVNITEFSDSKEILNITNDSREVTPGSLYVAITGFSVDGHNYIIDAVNAGAVAIVVDKDENYFDELCRSNNVSKIRVKDSRKAFADFSCAFYEHPSKKLTLVGITGSNGKTTTSFYVKNLFETAGYKTGLLGTISNIVGDFKEDSQLTTPESNTINKYLRSMVNSGITHCVMEVSSHSLALERVRGLDFDYAIFSNITSDHLDFHKDLAHYLNAKRLLFSNLKENAVAIVNCDDDNFARIISDNNSRKVLYGKSLDSDFIISNVGFNLNGTSYSLAHNSKEYQFNTNLIGEFNAYNSASAAIIGFNERYSLAVIAEGIRSTPQVPGRFEVISNGNKKVIVDYSHTADSLEKALTTIRDIVKGTRPIHTVFGCGGNRDKTKRPIMGEIADRLSDQIYITSDNPRFENPQEILNDILVGVKRENPNTIVDREVAIKNAICNSEENAVILIAGKGHEEYQIINGVKSHFSDKEIALKYLENCN